jgi:hypothetical protein
MSVNVLVYYKEAKFNQDMQISKLVYKYKVLEFDQFRFDKECELRQFSKSLTKIIEKLESTSQFAEDNFYQS